MNLGELIEELKKRNPDTIVKNGFGEGHSDRGYYANAAFNPVDETTFGLMLTEALFLLDSVQGGYKGGKYKMTKYVDALIGEWGVCGEIINSHNFMYWDSFAKSNPENHGPGHPIHPDK